ncbi:hypothetical protein [Kosmotoga pacifica]|uniref:hypothetical protein n=1 Tax=Kosmotoga pacifica TaxID=1330330 RepID=UPI0012E063BE|nr:hypothetical protein [Kosmotoga pacifica]
MNLKAGVDVVHVSTEVAYSCVVAKKTQSYALSFGIMYSTLSALDTSSILSSISAIAGEMLSALAWHQRL